MYVCVCVCVRERERERERESVYRDLNVDDIGNSSSDVCDVSYLRLLRTYEEEDTCILYEEEDTCLRC